MRRRTKKTRKGQAGPPVVASPPPGWSPTRRSGPFGRRFLASLRRSSVVLSETEVPPRSRAVSKEFANGPRSPPRPISPPTGPRRTREHTMIHRCIGKRNLTSVADRAHRGRPITITVASYPQLLTAHRMLPRLLSSVRESPPPGANRASRFFQLLFALLLFFKMFSKVYAPRDVTPYGTVWTRN